MYKKKSTTHIHFIGIGGIGMSGIAKILSQQGYKISGCDKDTNQQNIIELKSLGCSIYSENNSEECKNENIDIIVYSSAIKSDNAEILNAQKRGIPTIPRALMLAEIMRTKYSIAIAGSHGKTTTTSMISHILINAKKDPTVIIGGNLHSISTNAKIGNGHFLVAEADESDRSFLHLQATLAVVTNIDLEHLETYKDIDDIKETFIKFLNNLPFYGKAVICQDDPIISSLEPMPHLKLITYGSENNNTTWYAKIIEISHDHSKYTIFHKGKKYSDAVINMPGKHNILNSLAACAISYESGVSKKKIIEGLKTFSGVDRRFTFKGTYNQAQIFDDYGHHPVEIRNTIEIARLKTDKNLTVLFQPHRYTRTEKLWDLFVDVFSKSKIENLIITDIYSASENQINQINSQNLVKAIKFANPFLNVIYCPIEEKFETIIKVLEKIIKKDDVLLLQGAGKINKIIDFIIKK